MTAAEPKVNTLLSDLRLTDFGPVLAAFRAAGVQLQNALDGGAGSGSTARQMLPHIDGLVYAFEPFPGNHRFFADADPRVRLVPHALGDTTSELPFRVSSVVREGSTWGGRGMVGYSSVGKLVKDPQPDDLTVRCVRADDEIPLDEHVSFIKLDLQGGELAALKGMRRLLPAASLIWTEYMGGDGLLDYITEQGFEIFDTEYYFLGTPTARAEAIFEVARAEIPLSTGKFAWTGFKREPWRAFEAEFKTYRKEMSLMHTDLLCVNRSRFAHEFERALPFLAGDAVEGS